MQVWGIVAGDSFATTGVHIYIFNPLQDLVVQPIFHNLDLKIYLDDYTLQATRPTERAVARVLQTAADKLEKFVAEDLKCEVSEPKAEIVASTDALADKLAKNMERLGTTALAKRIRARRVAKALGMTAAAGRKRGSFGKLSVTAQRFKAMRRRAARARLLTNRNARAKLYTTWGIPGSCLWGRGARGG